MAGGSAGGSAATTYTLRGRVVNGMNGNGIARALVNANGRVLLTDAQGRFAFPQFSGASAGFTAVRPGFSPAAGADVRATRRTLTDPDAEVELKLYPNAVLTGAVTGSDGSALGQVQVSLRRFTPNQGVRWAPAMFAMTNSRGEYRITGPAGRYRLSVAYNPRVRETGETLTPVTYPEAPANTPEGTFALSAGEERRLDLRARTGPAYPVSVAVDRVEGRGGVRFTAVQEDGDGFPVGAAATGSPGEYRLELPSGSYVLRAQLDSREEALEGSAKVTVAGHAVAGVALHLTPATSLPLEVHAEQPAEKPAALRNSGPINISAAAPNARQLNLYLQSARGPLSDGTGQNIILRQREDKTYEFRVPPGRYRLGSAGQGLWYVTSASYGVTDLMSGEIVAGPGGAGQPIRITVSSQRGSLQGRVALQPGETNLWAYMLPRRPELSIPFPLPVTDAGGFLAWVPAGSYNVVVVEGQIEDDLTDPQVAARFAAGAKEVDVAADSTALVDFELQRTRGARR